MDVKRFSLDERRLETLRTHRIVHSVMYSHLPPSFSSAVACALSWSFLTKHWYIPLSSFLTLSILSTASSNPRGLPSFSHEIVLMGFPRTLQVKVAGLPKSMVWVLGSISAANGAVTVSTVSTLSPPTELFTMQRYLPESSTRASRMIRVPLT